MPDQPKPTVEVTIAYENGEADFYVCESFDSVFANAEAYGFQVRESEYSTVELKVERRGLNYIRKRTTHPKPQGLPA